MDKICTGILLFFMYVGALFIYPLLTFMILMNKWGNWIMIELKKMFINL